MTSLQRLARFVFVLSSVTLGVTYSAKAQQTSVAFDSGSFMLYATSARTTPLSGGTTADGNGTVIRLGYYSTATTSNLFSGTFIPLTGQGSANTAYATTSIGDANARGAGDGTFALNLSFTVGSATTGNNLPAAGTPLAIQFFNNTTLSTSTMYNAASDTTWLWQTPGVPGPTVTISFDDANVQLLGGASTAFYTSLSNVVPEPSTVVFLGSAFVGLMGLYLRRWRAA